MSFLAPLFLFGMLFGIIPIIIHLRNRPRFKTEKWGAMMFIQESIIEQLNNMRDLDEAMDYINTNFAWDMEKDAFKSFLELIYRRHIPVK